ncbi:hypothetical protein PTSG_04388 [Salpingoeca rosetta]|uniref:Purple acid phosphatase n=1 Tax=Salpingoeca rosetta (strain ATCC 50818 / BSB-021) TaxID=946362 RepID=F2U8E5_SALR5|nr:uncharacterized protein PTSG_04388 [Salpingoeca rosetta]EGD72653.1 hypothetical protein PTSG_04388 [Salpingoeca rosetta]|eukprot:XP_004994476.1 hypothetical protein PTSG_04388 [Salpingoeca rosetta]
MLRAAVIVGVVAVLASVSSAAPVLEGRMTDSSSFDPPTQVHLALGDTAGASMVVSWITTNASAGHVYYGTSKDKLNTRVEQLADAERYTFQSTYGEHYVSGLIHHAKIPNLAPLTKYYYRCGADGFGYSDVFSFTTPPVVGTSKFIFSVIGDLGQTANSSSTIEHIKSDPTTNLTVIVGDLSYADSAERTTPTRNCTQRRWDSWGELVEHVFANQPLMTLPGNHEIEQEGPPPATQEKFLAYQKRFRMPWKESGATNGNLYYSFEVGPVHFIMLNSYMDFDKGSQQYEWLLQDLKKVDRSVTPWLFASMHAPWYNSNVFHHNEPEETGMRAAMEDIMFKHNVDAIFSGHVHAYERMFPVYKNKTNPEAPTYLNIGDAGNREGPAYLYFPQPKWSAYREPAFGHGRVEIFNATHAHWTWHKNLNSEATVSDDVWLVRNAAIPSSPYKHGLTPLFGRTFDGFAPYKSF